MPPYAPLDAAIRLKRHREMKGRKCVSSRADAKKASVNGLSTTNAKP